MDTTTDTILIELPSAFYDDLIGDGPGGTIVSASRSGYKIRCTEEELQEIYSDAKHYAWLGTQELGREGIGLVSSARATVRRIDTYRNGGKAAN